uniref:Uncharacterized protein n=1 Tax=Helianthus annuus TaxID=4232 RepID=A0A251V7T3_HELAN
MVFNFDLFNNSGCGCCSVGWKSSSFLGFNSSSPNGVAPTNRFKRVRVVCPSAYAFDSSSEIED